jgi:transcriptional regulator with XRE-family HTH domain
MELTEINATWGRRIKRLRRAGEITAIAAAKEAGITPQYLHAIERGEYSPSDEVKIRIAKALGVEPSEIFSYDLEDAS